MSLPVPAASRVRVLARRVLPAVLAVLAVVTPAFAQEIDRTPPTITFEPLAEGRRGDTQVFSARVEDADGEVDAVRFHFRESGGNAYEARPMTPLPGTDLYTVSIEDLGPDVAAVEYYIDAIDTAGNRSIEGFAFDPLERVLVERGDSGAPAAETDAVPAADGLSTGRKIVYGVLGLLVVGGVAAALSGGGDDGGDDAVPAGDDGGGVPTDVPVTIVADPL